MGSIKIDIHKEEYEWRNVNEATLESIKGLLKYRYKFDPIENIDEKSMQDNIEEYSINYEAIHNYVDLDRHINKANLTKEQMEILNDYQSGMTEKDISFKINKSQSTVNGIIKTICRKIYCEALEEWKSYINFEIIKTKYTYKKCIKCLEFKPMDTEYFGIKEDSKDGFHTFCKKCR
jgi:DNA-binding CsgD family transcriptional regulator